MADDRAVLVVEDDGAVRGMLSSALTEAGRHTVIAVGSGEDALKMVRQAPIAVVVLDIVLPGIDGYEVARRLKADPKTASCCVIALTAVGRADAAQEAGCDQVLFKPVRIADLLLAVESGLGGQ
jgi:CheY-like chemotaxis protein